jgi:molecular chaperone DnaJ
MNINEAYAELGLSPSSTDEEIKTKYKSLAKQYHPDLNPEHAEKFKQINASHQAILEHRAKPKSPFNRVYASADEMPFEINFNDFFSPFTNFGQQKSSKSPRKVQPISLNIQISFKESVLGVAKDLQISRQIKCEACQGQGELKKGNGCPKCDGFGRVVGGNKNITYTTTCNACYGHNIKTEKCKECQGKTYKEANHTSTIQIPSGIANHSTIKIQGAGNFVQMHPLFGDTYGDILLNIRVEPDPVLSLQSPDVICPLQLTLLEALQGCQKTVPTIQGDKEIQVPSFSRHKEEVILNGLGVKGTNGVERVQFIVNYPEDKEVLINALKGN